MTDSDDIIGDSENRSSEVPTEESTSGKTTLLEKIVAGVKDQALLAILFVAFLSFGALWKGVSPTAVIALSLVLIFSILAVMLLPKVLEFLQARQETDNVWAHRKAELEIYARRLRDRNHSTGSKKVTSTASLGKKMKPKR